MKKDMFSEEIGKLLENFIENKVSEVVAMNFDPYEKDFGKDLCNECYLESLYEIMENPIFEMDYQYFLERCKDEHFAKHLYKNLDKIYQGLKELLDTQ